MSTPDGLDARIDLSNVAELLRVFDVNGDGLVDVMKTGESYQVWFALGRYPGGDGLFGKASWTGANAAQLSMAPVLRCVPWSSGSVVFGPSDVKLADMNGDGLTDIVRVRSSDVRYWPGRGDGTFGTGPLRCPGGTQSENSYVLMSESPDYSAPTADMVRLDDVNGDGTADMIQIRTETEVMTHYTRRGTVDRVDSTYGLLVDHVKRDAGGLVQEIQYGDAAATTTAFTYDDLRRLRNLTTYRARPQLWPQTGTGTQQLLLQDEQYSYDRVGNPTEVRDWRDASEWDDGAKPVTREMRYDDLYRLVGMDYEYSQGPDKWTDPYAAEQQAASLPDNTKDRPMPRADFGSGHRVLQQSWGYDWLGNTVATDDDQHAFWDRSLGQVTNGTPSGGAYKLKSATNTSGSLIADYDAAGKLIELTVERAGTCVGGAPCGAMRFRYEWDEVGRLVRARRWDAQNLASIPPPTASAQATLEYVYDSSDQRTRKTAIAADGRKLHTLYIFGSLELRRAAFDAGDYLHNDKTETVYLQTHGARLARVVHQDPPDEYATEPSTRVFLELGDQLGSTSVVLDRATGELVERSTAYAYGAAESDYRPDRWGEFREDYRFTGKEEDIEVGLQYFGKRFYAPLLQRWISPDPLAVHAPGQADLNLYAYVHGRVLVAVDPVGLQEPGREQAVPKTVILIVKGAPRDTFESGLARWAGQVRAARPNEVELVEVPWTATPETVVTKWQDAATKAQNGGTVINATGHGVAADERRGTEVSADFGPHRSVRVRSSVLTPSRQEGVRSTPAPADVQAVATFRKIAEAVRKADVKEVVLLTCNVGRQGRFVQEVANEMQTRVTAYRERIVAASGGDIGPRKRAVYETDVDTPGQGSNTERAETHEPRTYNSEYHAPVETREPEPRVFMPTEI